MDKRVTITVLGVFGIAATFVFGIVVAGRVDDTSTPLITTVLGFASLILIAVLQSSKVDKVDGKVDKVLNGHMDEKIRRVVTEVLEDLLTEHLTDENGNGSVTRKP